MSIRPTWFFSQVIPEKNAERLYTTIIETFFGENSKAYVNWLFTCTLSLRITYRFRDSGLNDASHHQFRDQFVIVHGSCTWQTITKQYRFIIIKKKCFDLIHGNHATNNMGISKSAHPGQLNASSFLMTVMRRPISVDSIWRGLFEVGRFLFHVFWAKYHSLGLKETVRVDGLGAQDSSSFMISFLKRYQHRRNQTG